MMYWNFPIAMVGAVPSMLNFILPISLAEIIGISYLIKKTKDDKKVFNKLNNELREKALPKKRNYEQDKELENEVLDKIKNVCVVYNELIHQQELLKVKQTEQSTEEHKKTNSILDDLGRKNVENIIDDPTPFPNVVYRPNYYTFTTDKEEKQEKGHTLVKRRKTTNPTDKK